MLIQEANTRNTQFSPFFTRILEIKCVDKGEVNAITHENQNAVHKVTTKAEKWFKYFDKDSSNSISPEELKAGLSQLNLYLDDQELSFLVQVGVYTRKAISLKLKLTKFRHHMNIYIYIYIYMNTDI